MNLALLLLALSVAPSSFSGKVVSVADGDTLSLLRDDTTTVVIRLAGIDAPEKHQAFGDAARALTTELVLGQLVTVEPHGTDRYGRLLAELRLQDGRSLNEALVEAGLAWWYRKYAPHNARLRRLEEAARAAQRGLWTDPKPTPPWAFRENARR